MAPKSAQMVQHLRDSFSSGKTKSLEYREKQLKNLLKLYKQNHDRLLTILNQDLGKSKHEAYLTELQILIADIENTIDNLKDWNKPEKVKKSLPNLLDGVFLYPEPYGVVLVIGAWNFPLQLTMLPVHGAIAAGNCVIIKPSEIAKQTEEVISELVPKFLDSDCYQVYTGGADEMTDLLQNKFDYIFYTGSTRVGRIIQEAASKHLTPTTLELGGKSPVYVDETAVIDITVKRILWGKLMNCGQVCISPDYILCTKPIQDKFVAQAPKILQEFYGENPKISKDYCKIINSRNFQRLKELINHEKVVYGGKDFDEQNRYFPPTIMVDVNDNDAIMQQEIFGPILPFVLIDGPEKAISYINSHPKPLALYVFSQSKEVQNMFLSQTSSGSVCVNDVIMQYTVDGLPFGGIGDSGMGAYHGKYTFDTFSHSKSVLVKDFGRLLEKVSSVRYPPLSDKKVAMLKFLLAKRGGIGLKFMSYFGIFFLGFASALAFAGKTWWFMDDGRDQ